MTQEYVSRRRQSVVDADVVQAQEEEQKAMLEEQRRRDKKAEAKRQLEEDSSYLLCKNVAKYMDDYYLDPLLGFFLPSVGDMITQLLSLPYIYVSLCKIKSIPLTLAIIYNMLIDVLIGCVPWLGDIIDCFYKSNRKNYRLIVGFVEDDEQIKHEVNRKALRTAIFIFIVCLIIYWVFSIIAKIISGIIGLF